MKFLWESNAPWSGTGYGTQTRLILSSLLARGHSPSCLAFYGLQGGIVPFDGYDVIPPSGFEMWGNDVISAHLERLESNAIVTLMDLFVLDEAIWSKLPVPWIAWVPIDHEKIGPPTLSRLHHVDYPVAMSHFGAKQMMEAGVPPASVIYHAVDTDIFKPMDKMECRRQLGLAEDAYIIGMVMANKGDRKQYPAQLAAIKQWIDDNPGRDNVKVYVHTERTEKMGGWDFPTLIRELGLEGHLYMTNTYDTSVVPAPQDHMATVMNCFDVLMNCSAGEGFGIPIVEAQACGVPVIATEATAMPELVHNGYTVEAAVRSLASHYGWQFGPSISDMTYKLECVYRMTGQAESLMGRQWVIDNCDLKIVADQWDELLKEIE